MADVDFYVGSYAECEEPGIYQCRLDEEAGELKVLRTFSGVRNPSYLARHPYLSVMYACCSLTAEDESEIGGIAAYSVGWEGELRLLGTLATGGLGTCHLAVHPDGKFLAAANYSSGSLSIIELDEKKGSLVKVTDLIQHSGRSAHPMRQREAHVHYVTFEGDELFSCDLGEDLIYRYHLDRKSGTLKESEVSYRTEPGDGPRHLALSPAADRMYVINEMGANVTVFRISDGALLQRICSIPERVDLSSLIVGDFDAYGAAIKMTADGRRVLASNRGQNTITVFSVGDDGLLKRISVNPTGGVMPRDFGIFGQYVIAAHQVSGNLTAFKFDENKNTLLDLGFSAEAGGGVCVL